MGSSPAPAAGDRQGNLANQQHQDHHPEQWILHHFQNEPADRPSAIGLTGCRQLLWAALDRLPGLLTLSTASVFGDRQRQIAMPDRHLPTFRSEVKPLDTEEREARPPFWAHPRIGCGDNRFNNRLLQIANGCPDFFASQRARFLSGPCRARRRRGHILSSPVCGSRATRCGGGIHLLVAGEG
ncbi:MAG: hypothetical protein V5B35_05510 [Candidatus Accumulibacter necessarius]